MGTGTPLQHFLALPSRVLVWTPTSQNYSHSFLKGTYAKNPVERVVTTGQSFLSLLSTLLCAISSYHSDSGAGAPFPSNR